MSFFKKDSVDGDSRKMDYGSKSRKRRNIGVIVACLVVVAVFGGYKYNSYVKSKNTESFKIYYTTDLHSYFTKNLEKVLEKRDKNKSLLVDAGDFLDGYTSDDKAWDSGYREIGYLKSEGIGSGARIIKKIGEPQQGLSPTMKKMKKYDYDLIAIGNHELYIGVDSTLKIVKDAKDANIPLSSDNIFMKDTSKPMVAPYIIKNIKLKHKDVKVCLVGGTTNTLYKANEFVNGKYTPKKEVLLEADKNYSKYLKMTDLVEQTKKTVKEVRVKENPDMVVLVVHSGMMPKKPRFSGNRAQELAKSVDGVDMIVGGHTHEFVESEWLDGKNGKKVLYTQSGAHSKGVGISDVKFLYTDGKYQLEGIEPKITKFKQDKNDPEEDLQIDSEDDLKHFYEINGVYPYDNDTLRKMMNEDKNIYLFRVLISDKEIKPNKDVIIDNVLSADNPDNKKEKLYYIKFRNLDTYLKINKEYNKLAQ